MMIVHFGAGLFIFEGCLDVFNRGDVGIEIGRDDIDFVFLDLFSNIGIGPDDFFG
jgi:hypothetical protein